MVTQVYSLSNVQADMQIKNIVLVRMGQTPRKRIRMRRAMPEEKKIVWLGSWEEGG